MVRSRRIHPLDGRRTRLARAPRVIAVAAMASALVLSACAGEPGTLTFSAGQSDGRHSAGPRPEQVGGRTAESGSGNDAARKTDPPATGRTPAEGGAGSDRGAAAEPAGGSGPVAPQDGGPIVPAASVAPPKGLLGERIRNTRARLSARFVYVPGVPRFTQLVDREIRAAIRLSGRGFTPQAFPVGSGLGERGCVPGSSRWSARDVLRRPTTAPPAQRGTAVTCDVLSASGDVIQIAMRTVKGSSTHILKDRTRILYADLRTHAAGEVVRSELWRNMAPAALWRRAVSQLIGAAGGTVPARLAAPSTAQLKLAKTALLTARTTAKQGIVATLPAGIAAPELAAIGIAATTTPTVVRVPRAMADVWSRELGDLLRHNAGKRFTGVKAAAATVHLDCRLLTCMALTYDDGPSQYTAALLATMRDQGARITLFMIGPNAQARPGVVRRALADGQEIGSHTMHHADLTMLSLAAANAEVKDAAAILKRIGGRRITLYRPPYGAINQQIIDRIGMPAILWNVDTNDWREPGRSALIARSVPVVQPGGIILFHDTHADSVAVAGKVVAGLRDRGFELVTVTQLFDGHVPVARISGRYY